MNESWVEQIMTFQRNEITEHHIYQHLADFIRDPENRRLLRKISSDELRHYHAWRNKTQKDIKPQWPKMWFYFWISRPFGFTFGIKLMERGENQSADSYAKLIREFPEVEMILLEENEHEVVLIGLLDEERLRYMGSIVLGLNDALVELTGGLAGLTLVFRNTRLIALSSLIVGFTAALSMAASAYLSTKAEKPLYRDPLKSSIYTGMAYTATVMVLISPYLILQNHYICLVWSFTIAVLVIAGFNYYLSVTRDEPFKRQFFEMAAVSFGMSALSFALGYIIRILLEVDI